MHDELQHNNRNVTEVVAKAPVANRNFTKLGRNQDSMGLSKQQHIP